MKSEIKKSDLLYCLPNNFSLQGGAKIFVDFWSCGDSHLVSSFFAGLVSTTSIKSSSVSSSSLHSAY